MSVLALAAGLCCLYVTGFAQMRVVQKIIPEGKWVLEKESLNAVIPGCMHGAYDTVDDNHVHQQNINVNINELDVVIYEELNVKQDSIILTSSKNMVRTKYSYTNREGIRYDSSSIPFLPGGNVFGDKLYVQQRIDIHQLDSNSPVFVSYIYELKKEK